MYYTERKPKNENGGGLGTRLLRIKATENKGTEVPNPRDCTTQATPPRVVQSWHAPRARQC